MRPVYARGPTLQVSENKVRGKMFGSNRLKLLWGIIRRVLPRRAAEDVGLRSFTCWVCGFECHRWHRYLSLVSVVCCQVGVYVSGWSLVQRSPNECDREALIMRPWPTRGCCAMDIYIYIYDEKFCWIGQLRPGIYVTWTYIQFG